ncbi:hypothetical protein CH295_11420 [Rhodococcus sp. 14-2483-1-2]|nr:hypothetical protein CH295_11420 [Rhodococcus sp. 14-2483-1-2]
MRRRRTTTFGPSRKPAHDLSETCPMNPADPASRSHTAREITDITRQAVIDTLTLDRDYFWVGKLDEVTFLSALYDLHDLPSTDRRYTDAAGDIHQHCINNNDWGEGWVFGDTRFSIRTGPDDAFLRFLTRTVHPLVRDPEIAESMVIRLNELLAPDSYELVADGTISGRTLYNWRRISSFHGDRPAGLVLDRATLDDRTTLDRHLRRIEASIATDPEAAIGACKELIESVFIQILDDLGGTYKRSDDLPTLYKATSKALGIAGKSVEGDAAASSAVNGLLRGLASSVQSLGELRNKIGTGHGRGSPSTADRRHARLALNSAVAISEFLFDVWDTR